ncbi:unnamed protein product, partial [Ixodes pacificus]
MRSSSRDVLAEHLDLVDEKGLQHFGALVEGRVARVVVAAVVKDLCHVPDELAQLLVLPGLQATLDRLQEAALTHGFFDDGVVVRRLFRIHRLQERPGHFVTSAHLEALEQLAQVVEVPALEGLEVGLVDVAVALTRRADVLLDRVCLALQDPDAAPVEPVLALVAADRATDSLRFVVGLPAEAVQFLGGRLVVGAALVTHILVHGLGLHLRQADALDVEPVGAQVAANHE